MDWRKKNIMYVVILAVSLVVVWFYRNKKAEEPIKIDGFTMGTTYVVTYFDSQGRNFKHQVDSLLIMVNRSISTYDSTSEVSRFNKGTELAFELPYLYPVLKKSKEVFERSGGAFDPSVMPLVNAWGFGPGKNLTMDSARVDSLMTFVGFDKINLTSKGITKTDRRVQLDFGGIGQGYGADVIADFLRSKEINDMLIELGGEGLAIGENKKTNKPWTVGILDPNSTRDSQFYKAYITLTDRSFTTSGSYFNYREIDGRKYSHTIDPKTGYPADNAILSASVFTDDCTTADAWATAFMVMGHERAIESAKQHPEMDVIFMYSTTDSKIVLYKSDQLKSQVILEP
jgi:thiamine biosynthesis lipoprotein